MRVCEELNGECGKPHLWRQHHLYYPLSTYTGQQQIIYLLLSVHLCIKQHHLDPPGNIYLPAASQKPESV
nr:hypothetical protein Q903MT_gene1997 [Picea sitchensis]